MQFSAGRIVGPTNGCWGQIYLEDNLFIVFEAADIAEPALFFRQVIKKITEEFQQRSQWNLAVAKEVLTSLNLPLETHLLLGFKTNNENKTYFYLLGEGEVEAWLKRKEKTAVLLSGQGAVSGKLVNQDMLMLVTPTFKKIFTFPDFKNLDGQPESVAEHEEKIAAMIEGSTENSGAAGLLICFFEKELKKSSLGPKNTLFQKMRLKIRHLHSSPKEEPIVDKNLVKKRKITASVGFLLSLVIFVSLFLGAKERIRKNDEEILTQLKEALGEKITQGKALADLNPNQGRKYLIEAKQLTEQSLPHLKAKDSPEKIEIEKILDEIENGLTLTSRIFKVTELPLFFDLTWIKNKAAGKALALCDDDLAVLDPENKTVYHLVLSTKKSEILTSGDLIASANRSTCSPYFVYILTKDAGKQEIVNEKMEVVLKNDDEWGEIIDLSSFSGNLYLLDKNGKIWKYPSIENGFGSKTSYLEDSLSPDFSQAKRIKVDGSIWILNQDKLTRFSQGNKANFFISEEDAQNIINFYTDDETLNLYLLLKEGALVVFDKDGNFKTRYESEKLKNIDDLVVSSSLKKILLLTSGKIYSLDIK